MPLKKNLNSPIGLVRNYMRKNVSLNYKVVLKHNSSQRRSLVLSELDNNYGSENVWQLTQEIQNKKWCRLMEDIMSEDNIVKFRPKKSEDKLLNDLETLIEQKRSTQLVFHNDKKRHLSIQEVFFLRDSSYLLGWDHKQEKLIDLSLAKIKSLNSCTEDYFEVSPILLEEALVELRRKALNENRLVLKFHHKKIMDEFTDQKIFSEVYWVRTGAGEHIWAGNFDPTESNLDYVRSFQPFFQLMAPEGLGHHFEVEVEIFG